MKILLVLDNPIEFINGVSQSVLNLEKGLTVEGHEVRILMPSPGGKMKIDSSHLLAPSHDLSIVYPGLRFSLSLTSEIRNTILKWKPDVIHSNTEGILYFKALWLAKKTGAKHIHSFHTNFLDFYDTYFLFGRSVSRRMMMIYGKLCFRRIDGMISPSLWGQQIMERFHIPAPHYILHNGIHTENFSSDHGAAREKIRRHYAVEDDEILLIFVGRVAVEKNISELIVDFCEIDNQPVKLMITGGGPALDSLKKQVERIPEKNRIIFTEMIPSEYIADYYAAADVFVTASRSEVQPLTYVEAMASGLPVVCADAPYIKGLVVNGETGYAFHTKEEFSEVIQMIACNVSSRHLMGEKAQKLVIEEYSIKTFARSAIHIYSDVLKGGKS